jgi:ABC-type sugar transport system permease subunit
MTTRRNPDYLGSPWTVALLAGPGLLLFGIFVAWPALQALPVSLESWNGFSPTRAFIGLANYRVLLAEERFWRSLRNTLYYVLLGGVLHLGFAFLFAVLLHHPRFSGKKLFQTLVVFPAFVSVVGVATLWERLYDSRDGLLNGLLRAAGLREVTWLSPEHGMRSIVVAAVWAGVGTHMLLLLAGLRRIPPSYPHAARLDGADEWQVFWRVTLPMLKNVTYAALALWLIGSMQLFGLIQALANQPIPDHLETVSTYQYAIAFNARDNLYMMGRGTAMAVLLALAIVVLVGLTRLAFGRRDLEY